jgi:hypothetical protein
MPSAHTLHYAVPLCFAWRMVRRGQHGLHFTCYRPLRYDAHANEWRCVACGDSVTGPLIAARALADTPLWSCSVEDHGIHPGTDSGLDRTGG